MSTPTPAAPGGVTGSPAPGKVQHGSGSAWEPFVWSAIGLALIAGFGLGGVLFAAPALGLPVGVWAAAAQVHGHIQLFGWAGLMVLGVGLHFLPRLRGRPLARPCHAHTAVVLLVAGLVLRSVAQPLVTLNSQTVMSTLLRAALGLSGVLELAGATLVVGLLLVTARGAPPLRTRPGFLQVSPFLVTAFAAFWLALVVNLVAVIGAALMGTGLIDSGVDGLTVLLALNGFVLPIAVGMGARIFPLHFASGQPNLRALRGGLVCLLVGLALRVAGELAAAPFMTALGLVSTALAYVLFVLGLQVFAPRRRVAGTRKVWFRDAAQWHGLSAFVWLLLDAGLLLLEATNLLLHSSGGSLLEIDRHILGAGFITLLILGEGANLLPGFGAGPLRSEALVWATLVFGNAAALLRVGPVLLPGLLPGQAGELALALSGLAGVLAVALLSLNLRGRRVPKGVEARLADAR
ncbi:MAG: hypothetical protein ACR2IK_00960 [Chloroflexota bacterium]